MSRRNSGSRPALGNEHGKGTVRTLITLLLVAVVVYAGMKFIPVRAAAFQFDDEIREQVVLAGSGRRKVADDEIRRTILARAQDLGLPVDTRNLKIRRLRSDITIEVEYTVPVELPGYTYEWTFRSRHSGPVF